MQWSSSDLNMPNTPNRQFSENGEKKAKNGEKWLKN